MNTAHERKSGEVARARMKLGFDDERVGVVRSCGVSSLANQRNLTRRARVIVSQVVAEVTPRCGRDM